MGSIDGENRPATWMEVIIQAPAPQAEAAADFLYNLTGLGVQINELGEAPGPVEVRGYLAPGAELAWQKDSCRRFTQSLGEAISPDNISLSFAEVPEQDWSGQWKKYFHPRQVVPGLVVAPPWEKFSPSQGQRVLIIDPGQAFGTGQHESTLLCLMRIARQARRDLLPARVLDVGCGTGILALAALIFGAASAVAIDTDPEALAAARQNARQNALAGRMEISDAPLSCLTEAFPLVLANLTAADLRSLAGDLAARLAPGGQLVASGLLVEQMPGVKKAFSAQGLTLLEQASLAGWASLIMLK